jgi:hypothetical protein
MQADKKFLAYKNVQEDDWKYPERLEKRDRIPVSDSHGDLFGTLSTLLTITTTFGSAFGPWGVAISLTAAIMNPIVSSFRPKVDMFAEALATVKRLERRALMDKLAGKLIAFGVWCVNQDGLFWSTDILMAEYQQVVSQTLIHAHCIFTFYLGHFAPESPGRAWSGISRQFVRHSGKQGFGISTQMGFRPIGTRSCPSFSDVLDRRVQPPVLDMGVYGALSGGYEGRH